MAWIAPGPGRPKGSKTKQQLGIEEKLGRLGCDPIMGMAMIALGQVPCPCCKGLKLAKYNPETGKPDPTNGVEMPCLLCLGSGFEPIAIDLKAKMFSELAQYIAPKRKAVEHSTDTGAAMFVIMGAQPDASPEDWERRNQERLQ